MNAQAANIHR